MKAKTDWEKIALALAKRVNFAVQHCTCKGGGLLDTKSMNLISWREYMVEAMEMLPGVKVDREVLAAMDLPPAKRKKALAEIRARKEVTE